MNPTLNRTLPLLASALLLAAMPSAHASPVGSGWGRISDAGDQVVLCMQDQDQCAQRDLEPCERLGLATLCRLHGALPAWCDDGCSVGDPTMDRDHDHVPDEGEKAICGRGGVRDLLGQAETAFTRCPAANDLSGMPDADRDAVPDWTEATLCAWEDENNDLDGSCDADGRDHTL